MRAVPGVSGSVREAAGGETAAGRVHPLQQDEHDKNAEALRKEPVEMMEKIKWGTMVERGRVTAAADGNATVESCDRPGVSMKCGIMLESIAAGDIVYCWIFPDGRGIVLAKVDTDSALMSAAEKKKLDELEVGARNLLRFSLNPSITYTGGTGSYQRKQTVAEWGCTNAYRVYGTSGSSRAFYLGGQAATIANGKNVSESGQSYAMSVWVKNAHATNSVIVCTPLGGERTLAPGESARCAFVVEGDGLNKLEIDFKPIAPPSEYDVYFWHPKIEIGSVATDWLPAPEDADEAYLALTGKPTENQTPRFGETVEVSQVKTDTGGRVTSLTTWTIKMPDTQAAESAKGLMTSADWAKMIGMPGYNLLPGYAGETTGTVGGSDAFKGFNIYESLAGLEGKPIAVSFDAKGTAGETLRVYAYQSSGLSIDVAQTDPVTCTLTADWKRFSFATHAKQWAGTLNDGMIAFWIQGGTNQFKLRKIKIETGTSATDWTPAVEDYAGEASVAFSSRRNTTNTSAASGTLRRVGKTVNLIFSATLENALAASTWLTIGTLPSGYLPTENIYTSAVWIGGTVAQVYIGTGSAIQVWSSQAQGAGAVVRGSVTWFVA